MTEREIIELAYNVRQKQKEYFKRYDRSVLAESKKLEKMLDIELEDYLHLDNRAKQDDDYLITVKYRRTRKVMKWDSVNGYFYIEGNVTAWAELPEPYKEQKNDQSRTN